MAVNYEYFEDPRNLAEKSPGATSDSYYRVSSRKSNMFGLVGVCRSIDGNCRILEIGGKKYAFHYDDIEEYPSPTATKVRVDHSQDPLRYLWHTQAHSVLSKHFNKTEEKESRMKLTRTQKVLMDKSKAKIYEAFYLSNGGVDVTSPEFGEWLMVTFGDDKKLAELAAAKLEREEAEKK